MSRIGWKQKRGRSSEEMSNTGSLVRNRRGGGVRIDRERDMSNIGSLGRNRRGGEGRTDRGE